MYKDKGQETKEALNLSEHGFLSPLDVDTMPKNPIFSAGLPVLI
jgi:hypothetical protein